MEEYFIMDESDAPYNEKELSELMTKLYEAGNYEGAEICRNLLQEMIKLSNKESASDVCEKLGVEEKNGEISS